MVRENIFSTEEIPGPSTGSFSPHLQAIPTGSLNLDIALGIGGVPRGQISEIYGPESSGKSTLCLHIVAEAQKLGGICAFIDADHALTPAYASCCGVDIERLLVSSPETAEQAMEIAETLARSGSVAVVVIDSLTALISRAELHSNLGSSPEDERIRWMSQALHKLNNAIRRSGTAVVVTNQMRHRPGKHHTSLPSSTATLALKLHTGLRLELKSAQPFQYRGETTGFRVQAKVVKNKLAPSYRTANLDILYNEGISETGDILDLALQLKIIKTQGSSYFYRGLQLGEGRANVINFLRRSSRVSEELERAIRQQLLPPVPMPVER